MAWHRRRRDNEFQTHGADRTPLSGRTMNLANYRPSLETPPEETDNNQITLIKINDFKNCRNHDNIE